MPLLKELRIIFFHDLAIYISLLAERRVRDDDSVFASWLPPNKASLAFAISFILLWLFFMWLLFRKNIIIKI